MICLQIVIVILLNILTLCVSSDFKGSTQVLPRSIAMDFSRRKRSLLLPNYGSIKLTTGITKAIISNIPKGLSLSWEISTYYAGPTSIKDWHGKGDESKDRSKIRAPQKKHEKKKLNYKNPLTPLDPFISYRNSSVIFQQRPRSLISGSKQADPGEESFYKILKKSKANNEKDQDIGHLDEANESQLGTDLKCSILKAFCKRQQFFKPPGYSMIQDIVKIMFFESSKRHEHEDERRSPTDFCNDFVESHLCYNRNSFNLFDKLLSP